MPGFDQQVQEAMQAVETGVADAQFDYPDAHVDDLYHEIAGSIATMHPPAVRREVKRRLGF
jgi:hypothetical protein